MPMWKNRLPRVTFCQSEAPIADGLLMKNSGISVPEASCQSARMATNSSRR